MTCQDTLSVIILLVQRHWLVGNDLSRYSVRNHFISPETLTCRKWLVKILCPLLCSHSRMKCPIVSSCNFNEMVLNKSQITHNRKACIVWELWFKFYGHKDFILLNHVIKPGGKGALRCSIPSSISFLFHTLDKLFNYCTQKYRVSIPS